MKDNISTDKTTSSGIQHVGQLLGSKKVMEIFGSLLSQTILALKKLVNIKRCYFKFYIPCDCESITENKISFLTDAS